MRHSHPSLLRLTSIVCIVVMALGLTVNGATAVSPSHPSATQSAASASGDLPTTGAVPPAAVGPAVACRSLGLTDDRLNHTGLVTCLEYGSQHINGADYRVFYPAEWEGIGGWGSNYLESAMEAVRDSVAVFAQYGTMASANILFSLLPRPDSELALADAGLPEFGSDLPCGIVVYPIASVRTEKLVKQAMAHELFHCVQDWNFDAQKHAQEAYDWWVEGTAEYFGNVVYPNVNYEFRYIPLFDANSPTKRLTQMSYENVVFWQYMGNRIGNEGILELIGTLPAEGGEAEQQAALRAYPGFAELFQDFAEAYLDKAIVDTGGKKLPVKPVISPATPAIAGAFSLALQAEPFLLYRYAPVFAPDMRFAIESERAGGPSQSAARPLANVGDWAKTLPAAIECGENREFVIAITSVAVAPEDDAAAVYTITPGDPCEEDPALAENDPCLIGTWLVTDFEAAVLGSYAATNAEISLEFVGSGGSLIYTFYDQEVSLTAESFEIDITASIAGTIADISIVMNGSTSASYHTEPGGTGVVDETPNQLSVVVTVFLDGAPVYSDEIPELWRLVGGPFQYACDGDTLELVVPGPDGQMLPPLVLTRQS